MSILDQYVTSAPSPQNALDIFKGEWISRLPGSLENCKAGNVSLFSDARIDWAIEQLGGIQNQRILELGPLEAGHTYILEQAGAKEIISIEANTRAYMKCLILKELIPLQKAKFLCGDFVEYLRTQSTHFDTCIACGVLYHMINPAELISLIAGVCDRFYLWTHYFDFDIISNNPNLKGNFALEGIPSNYKGFSHTLYQQYYQSALESASFCGGNRPFSSWMGRDDILSCLNFFGFNKILVNPDHDHPLHPNGPSFGLLALRH